ncbi:MAG: hypothetical protein HY692_04280 [Cyanobacteria bacterium NC_groundwater_1444_Ag_S-0.65um_54_12]|nr:hypothetical protein [Cyanobacteria bacterium NC_groundwater_1444_Ag_S-0.65um_54_12]
MALTRSSLPFFAVMRQRSLTVLTGVVGVTLILYVVTVIQEAQLSQWQRQLRIDRDTNVRLRTELSAMLSLDQVERRARARGLTLPNNIAYLPPPVLLPTSKPAGPIVTGVAEGY